MLARRFGRFEVLPAKRQALVDGQPAAVGARAFDLLLVLIAHPDRVLGKDELMALVAWGYVELLRRLQGNHKGSSLGRESSSSSAFNLNQKIPPSGRDWAGA